MWSHPCPGNEVGIGPCTMPRLDNLQVCVNGSFLKPPSHCQERPKDHSKIDQEFGKYPVGYDI